MIFIFYNKFISVLKNPLINNKRPALQRVFHLLRGTYLMPNLDS